MNKKLSRPDNSQPVQQEICSTEHSSDQLREKLVKAVSDGSPIFRVGNIICVRLPSGEFLYGHLSSWPAHWTKGGLDTNIATLSHTGNLADDLLRGADEIAEFLFGDPAERRKVYHLAATSRLPVFRLGALLCARRSVLIEWIVGQEQRAQKRG